MSASRREVTRREGRSGLFRVRTALLFFIELAGNLKSFGDFRASGSFRHSVSADPRERTLLSSLYPLIRLSTAYPDHLHRWQDARSRERGARSTSSVRASYSHPARWPSGLRRCVKVLPLFPLRARMLLRSLRTWVRIPLSSSGHSVAPFSHLFRE